MRPDIGDLIEGIKRSLSEEILPAVEGSFAREQLAYTLFLCEHLAARWDQAHLFVQEEHDDVHATLAAAVEQGRRCVAPSARFAALLDSTTAALAADAGAPQPLRAVAAASRALKETAVHFLEACDSVHRADAGVADDIRRTLRGFMERQLRRDEAWVVGAQIGWW